MNHVLRGCRDFSGAFIDDIVIFSHSWEDHLQHLREVLRRLTRAGFLVKVSNCRFGRDRAHYLGHVIGGGKLQPDPEYRHFIPQFSTVTAPLTDLTRKGQPDKIQFTESRRDALEMLKGLLLRAPILCVADLGKPFILQTDTSDRGLGAVLSQTDEKGDERTLLRMRVENCFHGRLIIL